MPAVFSHVVLPDDQCFAVGIRCASEPNPGSTLASFVWGSSDALFRGHGLVALPNGHGVDFALLMGHGVDTGLCTHQLEVALMRLGPRLETACERNEKKRTQTK